MTHPASDLDPQAERPGQTRTLVELGKYLLLGGGNFVLSLAVFTLGTKVMLLHYLIALVAAWFVGMLFMYVTNFLWVFNANGPLMFDARFRRFFGVGVVSICLNSAVLHLIVQGWQTDPFWTQMALLPLVVLCNFAATKYFALKIAKAGSQ